MNVDFNLSVLPSAKIDSALQKRLESLFEDTYAQANLHYLDKSAATFRHLAIAETAEKLVGFSFGDSVRRELPGFASPQPIALAGIACIDASLRKRGLFFRLATEAMNAGGAIDPSRPFLFAGRMAHPITYRAMAKAADTTVPTYGKPITERQKLVGVRIAEILGSRMDPDTFVVKGDGRPVGFPRLAYEATPEEEALFENVDRQNGDSLLSMCWLPTGPDDW